MFRTLLLLLVATACSEDTLHRVCPTDCFQWDYPWNGIGECISGVPKCEDGDLVSCEGGDIIPSPESCDGLDNNCDGIVDEYLTRECSTACGPGEETCSNGSWINCSAPEPAPEVCDFIDNDCDGQTDELVFQGVPPSDRVCYSGPAGTEEYPPCDYGMLNCIQGEVVCTNEVTPWIEVCDGVDNDCDGSIDEGTLVEVIPEPNPTFEVTIETNPDLLAETMVGNGLSIMVGSPSYIGNENAAGFFTGGISAGIGIESGIILTNGNVTNATPPNNSDGTGSHNGEPGDSDLDLLVAFGTHDATVLEFDFYHEGGDLYYTYVFASEEYNEFVGSQYNDVFGMWIDGINIALIPGTFTPVAINTINNGQHPELFINNDPTDGVNYPIEYDGFTKTLIAADFAVGVGTHHIKIAIADRGDRAFDSAVFIQGNSFSGCPE